MPAHQAQDTLEAAVKSVQAQTFGDWELLLVVDALSRDRTAEIAKKLAAADPRICLIGGLPRGGCAYNRNAAMRLARGRYLAFLDSDDLWRPGKLERQLAAMQERQATLSCTAYGWMHADGRAHPHVHRPPPEIGFAQMLQRNWMGCLTVMIDLQHFPNLEFREELHEDYILWLELTKTDQALGLQENLATYRLGHQTRSSNKIKSSWAHWRILCRYGNVGFFRRFILFVIYSIKSLLDRLG